MRNNSFYKLKDLAPELAKRVVLWNETARAEPPTIEQQAKIVDSELNEYLTAPNVLKLFDGVADAWFTGVYHEHLFPDDVDRLNDVDEVVSEGLQLINHEGVIHLLTEVVDNNFTKFIDVKNVMADAIIKASVDELAEQGVKVTPTTRGEYIVLLDENNKVRKPFTYVGPNILNSITQALGLEKSTKLFNQTVQEIRNGLL